VKPLLTQRKTKRKHLCSTCDMLHSSTLSPQRFVHNTIGLKMGRRIGVVLYGTRSRLRRRSVGRSRSDGETLNGTYSPFTKQHKLVLRNRQEQRDTPLIRKLAKTARKSDAQMKMGPTISSLRYDIRLGGRAERQESYQNVLGRVS
jgi:hypothetical protein